MRETENNKRYKAAMQGVGMQNVKMQQEAADKGSLQVNVTSSVNSYPISEARISISYTGVPENQVRQKTDRQIRHRISSQKTQIYMKTALLRFTTSNSFRRSVQEVLYG